MVTVAVMRNSCNRKTLLETELEEQFSDPNDVTVIGMDMRGDLVKVTQRLLTEMQASPVS